MVVFGAIAPHGEPAFVEGSATRGAMEDLARGLEHAAPQVTVVLTPHNVHVEGAFAVVVSATVAGAVDQPGTSCRCPWTSSGRPACSRASATRGSLRSA